MEYAPFKFFTKNALGRDFIVGDIHGMFSSLIELLGKVDFNDKIDRVFSVGDLIDRGAESYRAIEFLNKPWFFSIMGNHESMLIDSADNEKMYNSWVDRCGGDWWTHIPNLLQPRIRKKLAQLPIAIELETNYGNIGIVHADIPMHMAWPYFVQGLQEAEEMKSYSLWSRNRYKRILSDAYVPDVAGIDLVVVGHTPVAKPLQEGNVYFIDTGATYIEDESLAYLTLLEVGDTLQVHQISTYQRELVGMHL